MGAAGCAGSIRVQAVVRCGTCQRHPRCSGPGAAPTPSPQQIGDKDIDDLLNDLGALGEVAAYVADPPLVRPHRLHNISQIEVPPTDGAAG